MTLLALLSHLLLVLFSALLVRATVGPPVAYRSIQLTFDGREWQVSGVLLDGTPEFLDSCQTHTAALALAYRVAAHRNLPFSPQ